MAIDGDFAVVRQLPRGGQQGVPKYDSLALVAIEAHWEAER